MRKLGNWNLNVCGPQMKEVCGRLLPRGSTLRQHCQSLVQHSAFVSKAYWFAKYLKRDPYAVGMDADDRYLDTLSLIPPDPRLVALEMGCGEGQFTDLLAERVSHVCATDISYSAIRRARQRLQHRRNVQFTTFDLTHDPLEQDTYSLAVCMEVLYYIPLDLLDVCVEKVWRSVREKGFILLGHRRERPWNRGRFVIPFGAETIHARFKAVPALVCLKELKRTGDIISLFKRGHPEAWNTHRQ
jgi:SAM-dependent methyltransferase